MTATMPTSESPPSSGSKVKRPRGRPKRADAPTVPWNEVDRLLVHGEAVIIEGSSKRTRRYPTLRELGERFGVGKTRMWQYASRHKCFERRKEAVGREQARYDQIVTSRRAKARALDTEDVVLVVDDYIRGFQDAVSAGQVRMDSPADLDRLVRLKELLRGNADSRQELQGSLTLEAIQARHRALRGHVERMTSEVTGTEGVETQPAEPVRELAESGLDHEGGSDVS